MECVHAHGGVSVCVCVWMAGTGAASDLKPLWKAARVFHPGAHVLLSASWREAQNYIIQTRTHALGSVHLIGRCWHFRLLELKLNFIDFFFASLAALFALNVYHYWPRTQDHKWESQKNPISQRIDTHQDPDCNTEKTTLGSTHTRLPSCSVIKFCSIYTFLRNLQANMSTCCKQRGLGFVFFG